MIRDHMVTGIVLLVLGVSSCSAAENDKGSLTLVLVNGDQIHGELLKIAEGNMLFSPQLATDSVITIGLDKIARITFGPEDSREKAREGEKLRLFDESVLYGKFTKLTRDSLHFELEEMAPVKFPRGAVSELTRSPNPLKESQITLTGHVVVTTAGDVLSGDVGQTDDGLLTVSGGLIDAKLSYTSVATIRFARPKEPLLLKATGKKPVLITISTRRGSRFTACDPEMDKGKLSVVVVGGERIVLLTERIADISLHRVGKKLLYLKKGNPESWTVKGAAASQHEEIRKWRSAGYMVTTKDLQKTKITPELLGSCVVLRLNGSEYRNGRTITKAEGAAIRDWVRTGGHLFADIPQKALVPAVAPFGVRTIQDSASHGRPMTFGPVRLGRSSVTTAAAESLRKVTLDPKTPLKAAARIGNNPAIVYGPFGAGRVLIVFVENWSHDATHPYHSYRANVFQKENLKLLDLCITYLNQ